MLLLFFAFSTPVVLLIATMLYGGVTNDSIKAALANSNAYAKVSSYFSQKDAAVAEENQTFSDFASKRLSAEYFKDKTETAIDDVGDWITGKTQTPPGISFVELKNDLQQEDPQLYENIQRITTAREMDEADLTEEQKKQYTNQIIHLRTFFHNDFTVPIGTHLEGFKTVYGYLGIALPVLVVIMLLCLVVIAIHSHGLPNKLKWLGATFLVSSLAGLVFILLHELLADASTQVTLADQPDIVALMAPVLISVFNHYVDVFVAHQITTSTAFFGLSVIMLVAAFITRNQVPKNLKPLNPGKSYWLSSKKK